MGAKVKAIQNLYKHGKLTKEQIRAKVPSIIAEDEYQVITGESFCQN